MNRPHTWCPPEGHDWTRAAEVMTHLPTAQGVPELLIRACRRCPLVEALHVRHTGPQTIELYTFEHWSVDPAPHRAGYLETHVTWNKTQEG